MFSNWLSYTRMLLWKRPTSSSYCSLFAPQNIGNGEIEWSVRFYCFSPISDTYSNLSWSQSQTQRFGELKPTTYFEQRSVESISWPGDWSQNLKNVILANTCKTWLSSYSWKKESVIWEKEVLGLGREKERKTVSWVCFLDDWWLLITYLPSKMELNL